MQIECEMFKDRMDAAKQLSALLTDYRGQETFVLGLPRGGVVLAAEVANALGAELNVIFAHKISDPALPEYAIAATSESGYLVGPSESVDPQWLQKRVQEEQLRMKERRKLYLGSQEKVSCSGRRVILVDDGLATGLTMQAAILEVKAENPQEIIVAVPVTPRSTWKKIEALGCRCIAVRVESFFLGGVGAYYEDFSQVSDEEVMEILR